MTEEEMIAMFEDTLSSATRVASGPKKSESETYQYRTIDLTRKANRGSLFGRIVPDNKGRLFDFIERALEVKLPFKDEDGNEERILVRWVDSSNYTCELTEEEQALNEELHNLMDKIIEINDDTDGPVWATWYSRLHTFYMKITKHIPEEGDRHEYSNPDVTVCMHKNKSFATAFSSVYKAKNEIFGDKSWIKRVFSRDIDNPCEFVVGIDTKFLAPSYSTTITIDQAKPIPLTEVDLEKAGDLKTEFVDRTKFLSETIIEQIGLCKEYLDTLNVVNSESVSVGTKPNSDEGAVDESAATSVD